MAESADVLFENAKMAEQAERYDDMAKVCVCESVFLGRPQAEYYLRGMIQSRSA